MSNERSLRARVHDLVELGSYGHRYGAFFDGFLVVLIVANVAAVAAETVPEFRTRYQAEFIVFEIFSVVVFTVEYLTRVWVSVESHARPGQSHLKARLRYMATPFALIDLISILPFYLAFFAGPDLRFLRVFRLLRLFKLVRYSPALESLGRVIYHERRALLAALVIMLGILFVSASIMYFVERRAQPEDFGSIPAALWWAVTTLTTVGYGDVVPVTLPGRLVGGIVMIFGLGLYAIPIGIIASGFSNEIHRQEIVVRFDHVRRIPLFEGLEPKALSDVVRLFRSSVTEPGEVISRSGESGAGVYFILSGYADAIAPGSKVPLGPGDIFGESVPVGGSFREIAVIARTTCRLLIMDSLDFRHLLTVEPEIKVRLESVLEKYREASENHDAT